jgi:hypothetical protein
MATQMILLRPALLAGLAGVFAVIAGTMPAGAQTAPDAPAEAPAKPVKLVELIGKPYPMGETTEALDAPAAEAASIMRVRQGASVEVVGIAEGDGWYQIELPDKRLAYVRIAAIPAAAPNAPAEAPAKTVAAAAPAPAAPPEEAAADEGPAIDLPPTTDFEEASDQLSVANPTAVYLAPDKHSPQAYPVKVGTMVEVIAKSKDGNWAWVNTADGGPAYIPLADMAPAPAP